MDVAGLPVPHDSTAEDREPAPSPAPTAPGAEEVAWSPAKRLGFRFLAVLVAVYFFPFPLNVLPWIGDAVGSGVDWLWRFPQRWLGAWAFGLSDLSFETTGSGDRTVDYLMLLLLVALAVVGALAWTLLDRRRRHYRRAARWLEVLVRYELGLIMLSYGIVKVIPSQFPAPSLNRLLQAYGDSSPMGLLWTFMGSSAPYTIFAGAGEVIGGVLVLFKRTRALGALVLVGVLSNVVMLNFAYDVPVKLFSSYLLLMAIGLLALDARRLAAVFLTHRTAPPAEDRPLFRSRRWNLAAKVFAGVLVASFLWSTVGRAWSGYTQWGARREKTELWGIYDVDTFTRDGQELPPLTTDPVRWRTLVVDRARAIHFGEQVFPGSISVQQMDGTFTRLRIELDEDGHTITLLPEGQTSVEAAQAAGVELAGVLRYERAEPGLLTLRGHWQDSDLEIHLTRRELASMLLTGRGFHWINETPYNR